jgi:L-glutamine---4-(methylsulfanyl)-2-oxobutanoate aminotransferase
MRFPESYYTSLGEEYSARRDSMLKILDEAEIPYFKPQGAYYTFCDISKFGYKNDVEFTEFLVKDIGVAVVPGSSFFRPGDLGHRYIRFCFAKKPETLDAARSRLMQLKDKAKVRA